MCRETVNLLLFVPLAKGSPEGRKRPHVMTEEWTRDQRAGVKAHLWAGKVAAALSKHPRLADGGGEAAHLLEQTLPALVLHAAHVASSSSLRMILTSLLTSSATHRDLIVPPTEPNFTTERTGGPEMTSLSAEHLHACPKWSRPFGAPCPMPVPASRCKGAAQGRAGDLTSAGRNWVLVLALP